MEAYKIVTIIKGHHIIGDALVSGFVGVNNVFCTLYQLNKPSVGHDGNPLFAFDTIDNAMDWAKRVGYTTWDSSLYRQYALYRVEVVVSKRRLAHIPTFVASDSIERFWECVKKRRAWMNTSYFQIKRIPKGTILCDSITLLERLK